jgi:hypothetical protein
MSLETYDDTQREAVEALTAGQDPPMDPKMATFFQEAERAVREAMEKRVDDGQILLIGDEEKRLLDSFRKFKAKVRKQGEVFKWQTGPGERE